MTATLVVGTATLVVGAATFTFVLGVAFASIFFVVGLLGLLFPERVRAFYLDNFRRALAAKKLEGFSFVLDLLPGAWFFRTYGIVSLVTAAVIVAGLLWK